MGTLAPFLCIKQIKKKVVQVVSNKRLSTGSQLSMDENQPMNKPVSDIEANVNVIEKKDKESKISRYFAKLSSFIRSPCVYYLYEVLFYLVFLLLFSYTLLCGLTFESEDSDLKTNINSTEKNISDSNNSIQNLYSGNLRIWNPNNCEIILIVWVITILIEELYQVT